MNITGAVALVAGGGGGFGAATARRLHAAGASVVICDLDAVKGKAVVEDLGERAVFVETDVTDEASVQAAIDAAEKLGSLRITVIAHGGPGGGRTLNRENEPIAQDDFMRVVNIFLGASYNLIRMTAASMAKTEPLETGERGVIINTASIAAFDGTIGQAAYSAAKGGIVGMTLPIARDLSPIGVRVMTIAPGTFLTPAFGDADPVKLDAYWGAAVPFPKRMGRPEEYAQLALQICENPYLNGETIRLDGALRFTPKGA
ncbi:SDR family NAD(P)-dependent oxidoreductase [Aeromicrobium sp. SMF47]|uniref:SDR family NAD(P)-dependent oxidoreductase n=1 Tax=Aeromicrobium yanjiei TaxID=2662028 RepID=A0A5Q2MEP6_9ACTN|nr:MULTISPECIES: SDR family NAD(P)-dependent oxidoreductase [Aeromicrobium]MRJ77286.1 SDR family NAD(P)-dependent oxidoreductase [Aeromicrobium yanjiei]MRK01653.1 SDR family NAD(P)-dependent oxidoreductase [Aeromicrobium sp. S22]QGG41584.1 SDR family NAD(P)-dependent oxidoreductase [Aeromicrobium yanjiei]